MVTSDRVRGSFHLITSGAVLLYLFILLMIIPILPIDENYLDGVTPPILVLYFCGTFGLIFIGALSFFTIYIMSNNSNK